MSEDQKPETPREKEQAPAGSASSSCSALSDAARRRHARERVVIDLERKLHNAPTVEVSLVEAVEFRRDQYGLRAIEWAKLLGVSKTHYSEFVAGKRGLSYRVLRRLYVLGVPADVILLEYSSQNSVS